MAWVRPRTVYLLRRCDPRCQIPVRMVATVRREAIWVSLEIRPPDRAAVGFRRELSCSTLRKPPQNSMHVSWRHGRLLPSRWRAAPPQGVRRQRESMRTPASASAQAVRLSRLIRQLEQTARATTPRRKTRFHQSEYSSPRSELFLGGCPGGMRGSGRKTVRSARFDRRRAFSDRGQDERSYLLRLMNLVGGGIV